MAEITGSTLSGLQRLLSGNQVDGVIINKTSSTALKFLGGVKGLKAVAVPNPSDDAIDCSPVADLQDLTFLSMGRRRTPLDLSKLTHLEELRIDWNSRDALPSSDAPLKTLVVASYSPNSNDLSGLPDYGPLEYLEFVRGAIERLNGLERFKSLKHLEAHYCARLSDISALKESGVEFVLLQACKNLSDLEILRECRSLRTLALARIGPLPSLEFLRDMPALRDFRLVDTDVSDGDISVLAELPLENVAISPRRHFSHSEAQIRAEIAEKFGTIRND